MFDAPDMFAAAIGFVIGAVGAGYLVWNDKDKIVAIGNVIPTVKADAESVIAAIKAEIADLEAKASAIQTKITAVKAAIEK